MTVAWAVRDTETGQFVEDKKTGGVAFGTRDRARNVRNRLANSNLLRVVPVTTRSIQDAPRA